MNFGPMANSFFIALSHSCYMFLSEKKKKSAITNRGKSSGNASCKCYWDAVFMSKCLQIPKLGAQLVQCCYNYVR